MEAILTLITAITTILLALCGLGFYFETMGWLVWCTAPIAIVNIFSAAAWRFLHGQLFAALMGAPGIIAFLWIEVPA